MRPLLAALALTVLAAQEAHAADSRPFEPIGGSTVSLTCDATGEVATLTEAGTSLLLTNVGSTEVHVLTGDSDQVDADVPADMPLLPESQNIITRPRSHTHISCKTASGTSVIRATSGNGI